MKRYLLLPVSFLFCYAIVFGQKKKDVFSIYTNKVEAIVNDSAFNKIVHSGEDGSSQTGYFRNDSLYLITEYIIQEYVQVKLCWFPSPTVRSLSHLPTRFWINGVADHPAHLVEHESGKAAS